MRRLFLLLLLAAPLHAQDKLDASTLGGNSGSAVIDYDKGLVVGLHFGGRYLEGNNAVPLWKLVDDPLLKKAKVNFA